MKRRSFFVTAVGALLAPFGPLPKPKETVRSNYLPSVKIINEYIRRDLDPLTRNRIFLRMLQEKGPIVWTSSTTWNWRIRCRRAGKRREGCHAPN